MADDVSMVRTLTVLVVILAPVVVVLYDLAVLHLFGGSVTITDVIREWSKKSAWPEVIFVLGVVALYLHLFRHWL